MAVDDPASRIQPATGSTVFTVDTGRLLLFLFLFCLTIEVLLVYLDLVVNWRRGSTTGAIQRMFNITREDSLSSWFAVTQTFVLALVVWAVYAVVHKQGGSRWQRVGWLVLAMMFTYMAIDDGAAVHERLGTASKKWAATSDAVQSFPSYAWQVLFVPLFASFGLFMLYFLWKELPRPVDRLLVVAALGCFTVAVIMDYFEGLDDGYGWWVSNYGWKAKTMAHFSKSIEEFLEMLGITLLLVTFLGHLARTARTLRLDFN